MNHLATSVDTAHLKPGTVLRIDRGLYSHVAILGQWRDSRKRSVLTFGPGPLEEVAFEDFAAGKPVVVEGYLGSLHPSEVLDRARRLGARTYSWISFNCEHFVRAAHGLNPKSPQLQRAFAIAGLALWLTR